jgi:hypothetical protein
MLRPRSSCWLVIAACHASPTTRHACPTDRPVILAGQDDIVAFAGCTSAASVTIRTGMALDLAPLASLTTIRGDLVIGPSVGLEEVKLTNLATVGGEIRIASNSFATGAFFPALVHARAIVVTGNGGLATLSLPHLATLDGALTIADDGALELVEASALTSIGGTLAIRDAPQLALVELAALAHVGGVEIENANVPNAARLRALAPEKPQ